jgi:hypothetical protein
MSAQHVKCSITNVSAKGTDESPWTCIYSTALTNEEWLDNIRSAFKFKRDSELTFLTPQGDVFPGLLSALRDHRKDPAGLVELKMYDEAEGLVRFSVKSTKAAKGTGRKKTSKPNRRIWAHHRMAKELVAYLIPRDGNFYYYGVRDKRLTQNRKFIH